MCVKTERKESRLVAKNAKLR